MEKSIINAMIDEGEFDDKRLFHYTKLETALEYILPNMTLRMSPMMNVNDPKESKGKNVKLSFNTDKRDKVSEKISATKNTKDSVLLKQSRIVCLLMNKKSSYGKIERNFDDKGVLYQLGFFKPRMWAQYADNHRGVCLGFDKELLTNEINNIKSLKTFRGRYIDQMLHMFIIL